MVGANISQTEASKVNGVLSRTTSCAPNPCSEAIHWSWLTNARWEI